MSIDLKTISLLRDKTGAGIVDCKTALTEANGDLDQAVEILRKKGEIKAAKKADRATSEGVVAIARTGNKVATAVVVCETDFVSRSDDFNTTVQSFAQKLLTDGEDGFRAWAEGIIKNELVVKIGENIQLSDFGVLTGEVLGTYVHSNKKVAGIVALTGGSDTLATELAMQVVAMSPKYLKPEDVPAEILQKEKEIYLEQLKAENKPAEMLEKIVLGKLAKFYEEVCLLNQIYIKDDKKKVSDLVKEAGAEIAEFRRFSV